MTDTDSKLTGWISVCHGVPPCQPLSAQPVRPFYNRQPCHKGDRVYASERKREDKKIDSGEMPGSAVTRKAVFERAAVVAVWENGMREKVRRIQQKREYGGGNGSGGGDRGIETLYPDVSEVLYWLCLLFAAALLITLNREVVFLRGVRVLACPPALWVRPRIFSLILTFAPSYAGPHSEAIVHSPLVTLNGQ